MASAHPMGSLRDRLLATEADAAADRYGIFADMADAYVARTLEALSSIDAATRDADHDPVRVERMAEIRARLDGLDDLIVALRQLQARTTIDSTID